MGLHKGLLTTTCSLTPHVSWRTRPRGQRPGWTGSSGTPGSVPLKAIWSKGGCSGQNQLTQGSCSAWQFL